MKEYLENINKAFESKARLGIMSILVVNESVDFVTLKNLLDLTDGNLASHTRSLEELGYIQCQKQFIGRQHDVLRHAERPGSFCETFKRLGRVFKESEYIIFFTHYALKFKVLFK